MRNFLLPLCLAWALAGCSSGTNFSWAEARKLHQDMSDQEVKSILGQPNQITSVDGKEVWTWAHVNTWSGESKFVTVSFQNGRVTKAPNIPSDYAD